MNSRLLLPLLAFLLAVGDYDFDYSPDDVETLRMLRGEVFGSDDLVVNIQPRFQ